MSLRNEDKDHLLDKSVTELYMSCHLILKLTFFSSFLGQAIVSAVTGGSTRFFLGTDSAPHDRRNKECSCGCAGIYNSLVALSIYAKVFEEVTLIVMLVI